MFDVPDGHGSDRFIAHPLWRPEAQPLGEDASQDAEHALPFVIREARPEASQLRRCVAEVGRCRFRVLRGMVDPSGWSPDVAGANSPGSGERSERVQAHHEYRPRHGVCRSVQSAQQVKRLKRQMYGRAGFDLLRCRFLQAG